MKPPLTVELLKAGGFQEASHWRVDQAGLLEILDLPAKPGVYAFAIDGVAQYVGIASNSLFQRLRFYARPGATQRTSLRLNRTILELCGSRIRVEVLIAFPGDFEWGGFKVRGPEGLEAGIISAFDLPWNIRGAGTRKAGVMTRQKSGSARHATEVASDSAGEFFVYENWVRDKAIVHRSNCSFCNGGNGLHGSRQTKSSTWHGPFGSGLAALEAARRCRRTRTEGCSTCSPI
jgi:hypothetical protein